MKKAGFLAGPAYTLPNSSLLLLCEKTPIINTTGPYNYSFFLPKKEELRQKGGDAVKSDSAAVLISLWGPAAAAHFE